MAYWVRCPAEYQNSYQWWQHQTTFNHLKFDSIHTPASIAFLIALTVSQIVKSESPHSSAAQAGNRHVCPSMQHRTEPCCDALNSIEKIAEPLRNVCLSFLRSVFIAGNVLIAICKSAICHTFKESGCPHSLFHSDTLSLSASLFC